MGQKRWDFAAAAYRQALRSGAPDPGIYTRLGNALTRNLEISAAADAYRQALRLDPRNPEAQRGLELLAQMSPASEPAPIAPAVPFTGRHLR
jgi:cytochrome c-type biogenesis protein CcmH/NrfG